MEHPYEYRIIQQFLTPQSVSVATGFDDKKTQLGMLQEVNKMVSNLPTIIEKFPEGGDWFPNSHSIALMGNTVVVSILLQRHRK